MKGKVFIIVNICLSLFFAVATNDCAKALESNKLRHNAKKIFDKLFMFII